MRRVVRKAAPTRISPLAWALAFTAVIAPGEVPAEEPGIVYLMQLPCQFVEPEGKFQGFESRKASDCEAINARTGAQRAAESRVLELAPGPRVFRVKNEGVPYEVGFWLRGAGVLGRVTLPSVSGGGIVRGEFRDYVIDLVPGEYLYSCPLNPTPDYRLIVR